jgi:hypothetical protein
MKLRNANHPVVMQIVAAAQELNCEILEVNLRRDWFHIRNGKEVRIGTFWKGISRKGLIERVSASLKYGIRIDENPNCLYRPYIASIKDDGFPTYADICKQAADVVISQAKRGA